MISELFPSPQKSRRYSKTAWDTVSPGSASLVKRPSRTSWSSSLPESGILPVVKARYVFSTVRPRNWEARRLAALEVLAKTMAPPTAKSRRWHKPTQAVGRPRSSASRAAAQDKRSSLGPPSDWESVPGGFTTTRSCRSSYIMLGGISHPDRRFKAQRALTGSGGPDVERIFA